MIGMMFLLKGQVKSESFSQETDKSDEIGVMIFPNPVSDGEVTISAEKIIAKIQLLNIVGEQISIEAPEADKSVKLNLTDLKTGIYLIKITFADNTGTTKKLWVK
jgi:hypothetical protein